MSVTFNNTAGEFETDCMFVILQGRKEPVGSKDTIMSRSICYINTEQTEIETASVLKHKSEEIFINTFWSKAILGVNGIYSK